MNSRSPMAIAIFDAPPMIAPLATGEGYHALIGKSGRGAFPRGRIRNARQLLDPLVGADLAEYKVEGFASDLGVSKATSGGCFGTKMLIKRVAKYCGVAGMVLIVIFALGPANWQPRTGLGWGADHFLGYFAITLVLCLAWPRPFVVGGAIMAIAALLEGLQAFTPDRSANILAALSGAGGALAAALVAELFIRARRWHAG
jgi:VanZ family protein